MSDFGDYPGVDDVSARRPLSGGDFGSGVTSERGRPMSEATYKSIRNLTTATILNSIAIIGAIVAVIVLAVTR